MDDVTPSSVTVEEALALVRSATPEQRASLAGLVSSSPALSLWSPNPGPQADAYHSEADEIFYGGAAGGGKSALIAGLALTRHLRTLIVRRESTQMRGMIDDIARTLKTREGYSQQNGQWRVPAALAVRPGQLIEFGGVPDPGSEEKHQGIPHDLLAFDEVTQIGEYVVDYLTTWNRSTDPGQRCRVVLTSNPPTPSTQVTSRGQATGGGLWLVRRYAPWLDPAYRDPLGLGPAKPGELRWFVTLDGVSQEWPDGLPFAHVRPDGTAETVRPRSRTFIPARVTDNPYLAVTDYAATLQRLPEPLRSAMLYGDFSVSLSDRPRQLIPTEWLRSAHARWEALRTARPAPDSLPMTALGADVSRSSGGDSSVLQARHGDWYAEPVLVPSSATLNGASMAARIVEARRDGATVVIDAAGVGASAYDHLRNNVSAFGGETGSSGSLTGYVGSSKAWRRDRSGHFGFPNLRSQSYWLLREALDPATPPRLAIPPDDDLTQELLSATYTEQSGKLQVIRKEDLVKLLGRSPDRADALVMASTVRDPGAPYAEAAESKRSSRLADVDDSPVSRFRRGRREIPRHGDGRRASWSDPVLPTPRRV